MNTPRQQALQIVRSVAEASGVPVEIIFSRHRYRGAVRARHRAIKAVNDAYPEWSTPRIGRLFGMDHTSILHALRRTKQAKLCKVVHI